MDIDGEITLTTAPRWAHPKGVIRQVHMYSTQSQFTVTVTVALGRKIPFVVYLFMYCIFMGFFFFQFHYVHWSSLFYLQIGCFHAINFYLA